MAWGTPSTFKTGDLVDDDTLNAQLKDNLNALSTHTHSGAAGDGSADLAGVDSIVIDSTSAPSSPSANDIIAWVDGETLKMKKSDGTVQAFSLAGHTH